MLLKISSSKKRKRGWPLFCYYIENFKHSLNLITNVINIEQFQNKLCFLNMQVKKYRLQLRASGTIKY